MHAGCILICTMQNYKYFFTLHPNPFLFYPFLALTKVTNDDADVNIT